MRDKAWETGGVILGIGLFIALFVGFYACNEEYEDDCRSRGGQVVRRFGDWKGICIDPPRDRK